MYLINKVVRAREYGLKRFNGFSPQKLLQEIICHFFQYSIRTLIQEKNHLPIFQDSIKTVKA